MTEAPSAVRRLAPLALVAVLAASCGDNDKTAATTERSTTAATTTTGQPSATPSSGTTTGSGARSGPGRGTLVVGTRDLYPLLGTRIARFAPTQVTGTSVRVISVVGPDSFWAGRGENRRILVKMRLKGGTRPKIRAGRKVDFVGRLTEAPVDAAAALGIRGRDSRLLIGAQGAYVDASAADVKLR